MNTVMLVANFGWMIVLGVAVLALLVSVLPVPGWMKLGPWLVALGGSSNTLAVTANGNKMPLDCDLYGPYPPTDYICVDSATQLAMLCDVVRWPVTRVCSIGDLLMWAGVALLVVGVFIVANAQQYQEAE
jgi:Family of unknown function (DUF5317)